MVILDGTMLGFLTHKVYACKFSLVFDREAFFKTPVYSAQPKLNIIIVVGGFIYPFIQYAALYSPRTGP